MVTVPLPDGVIDIQAPIIDRDLIVTVNIGIAAHGDIAL